MKITGLHISNFMTIGAADLSLADKGLVLIEGVNEDDPSANSNGSGKSTVADALMWCLYGETRSGLGADDIINNKAKSAHVAAVIEDGADRIQIDRYRKNVTYKNNVRLTVNGVDRTKGTNSLTQDEINRLVGCSPEVFATSVYASYENLPNLPTKTDKELKTLIEEVAGVNVLTRGHKLALEKRSAAEANLKNALTRQDNIGRELGIRQSELDDLRTRSGKWAFDQTAKISTAKMDLAVSFEAFKNKRAAHEASPVTAQQAARAEIDARIAGIAKENERETDLSAKLVTEKSQLASQENSVRSQANQIRVAGAELGKINTRIGTPCGECGKTYCEEDLGDAKRLVGEKIVNQKRGLDDLQTLVAAQQDVVAAAEKALADFRATKVDVRDLIVQRDGYDRQIAAYKQATDEIAREALRLKSIKASIDEMEKASNPFDELIERATENVAALVCDKGGADEEVATMTKRARTANQGVQVYAPAGARAEVLDNVTPYLNSQTAGYLAPLSDGQITAQWTTLSTTKAGELKEKFSIDVKKAGAGQTYGALSGGEKRKVRLATALALQDLLASRASKPIELFIGDEIDDALDASGLERLMGVLEEKARDKGTVVIISHGDLNDWCRTVTRVVRKDGITRVEGALCA